MSEVKSNYSVEETIQIQMVKLNLQLKKLIEQNEKIIDLQNERDTLAAQVEALKQSVISTRARGNLLHNITLQILQGAELNGSDWDYISESQVAEIEQHLAELRAEAVISAIDAHKNNVMTFGFDSAIRITDLIKYANKIRQGEVK